MTVQTIFGDCLEKMKDLPAGSVDLVLTDPPYGTTACPWDSIIPFDLMWERVWHVLKPTGACVLFASQPFTSSLGASQLKYLKYSWVWEKTRATGHLNAKRQPMTGFEDILVFYRKQPTYNPQGLFYVNRRMKNSASNMARGKNNVGSTISGGIKSTYYVQETSGYPKGILKFSSASKTVHPTQKPVPLLEYLVKTYTNEGETVLDFTMGSGSTGIACVNTDRQFIGIEKESNYFSIANERILQAAAVKENQLFAACL